MGHAPYSCASAELHPVPVPGIPQELSTVSPGFRVSPELGYNLRLILKWLGDYSEFDKMGRG